MKEPLLQQGEGTDAMGAIPSTSSPSYATRTSVQAAFDHFASHVTRWAGSPGMFCAALLMVLAWAVTGPIFHFSENWQLVINTGTTIVTFLMVFLIQQSQNKDSVAIHLKLNELLAANRHASNRMIGIEDLDEQDLREVASFYVRLAERARQAGRDKCAHSIDEEGMSASAMDAHRPAHAREAVAVLGAGCSGREGAL